MKTKKIVAGPIPNVLSLMPVDDTFEENWHLVDGAWISDNHWDNINHALSANKSNLFMNIRNEISESNTYAKGLDGVWLTTEGIMNIEGALSGKDKEVADPKESQKDKNNKKPPGYLDPDSPENAWFDRQTRYR